MPFIGRSVFERAIMLDTGPLISLYDPNDNRGEVIAEQLKNFQKLKYPVYITAITIAETHKRILYDINNCRASLFLETIQNGNINILEIKDEDIDEAISILSKYSDQEIPFADASTMAVMKRVGIKNVVSFDWHFGMLNFTVLQ